MKNWWKTNHQKQQADSISHYDRLKLSSPPTALHCFPIDSPIPLLGTDLEIDSTSTLATGIHPDSLNGYVTLNEIIAVQPLNAKNKKSKKKPLITTYQGAGITTGIGLHLIVMSTCKSDEKDCYRVNIVGYATLSKSAQAQLRSLPQSNPCIRSIEIRSWSARAPDTSLKEDVYIYVDVAGKGLRK